MSDSFAAVTGSLTIGADLGADELGRGVVGRLVHQDVVEGGAELQAAVLPGRLVQRLALLLGRFQRACVGDEEVEAVGRLAHPLADLGVVVLHVVLEFRRQRPVAGRHAVVGRALEHGQVGGLLGDHRGSPGCRSSRCRSAPTRLPVKSTPVMRPLRRCGTSCPANVSRPGIFGDVGGGQAADGGDQEASPTASRRPPSSRASDWRPSS